MIYKQIAVRLPRLLDKDLNEVRRLRPDSQSIELNITPPSTASIMLQDGSGIVIRSFVELFNAKGSAGIFRVSMPEETYGGGDRIALEHGICTLDDAIVPGTGTIEGAPRSVFERILAHQTTKARGVNMWRLGVVEMPESETITVEHDGTRTLEMLIRAVNALEGYMLSFSQAEFPWTVHVLSKKTEASCEGRLSRNIRTIRKTIDYSDQCTRLYCSQLDSGYIESDTIGAWGAIEKEITLNDDTPKADVEAYCRKYIENRKNPSVAIEMDADEWFAMTGERLDRFEIGDICRLAMPEYGVVIEERIVALNYMDAMGRPEQVTVSIANQIRDMTLKAAEMAQDIDSLKHTSTGYGNRISSSEKNITNLKAADEGFKEVDNKVVKWFSSAEINLDATEAGANVGILATYKETRDLFDEVGERVAEAELILHGGPDGAQAGLIARVDDNEASLILQADELGTLARIKADVTYVNKLVADEIEAAISDFNLSIAETIVTNYLTVKSRATLGALALDGENVSKETVKVIKSISGLSTTEVTMLAAGTGGEETASFYQRGALFQGTAYDTVETREYKLRGDSVDDAYHRSSSRVKLQGTKYSGKLYDADGEPVSDMYLGNGSYVYQATGKYEDLYEDGGEAYATVGVVEHTGALYQPGTRVSITTREVTALTV